MDNNKKIAKALLEKNYADAKEHVFNALYAKASLLLDEQRVAVAEAVFNEDKAMGMYSHDADEEKKETKKKKTKSEKPSMYEEAEEVAEEVAEEEAELEEDIQTPERAAEMRRKVKASDRGVDRAAAKYIKTPTKANNQAHSKAIRQHFDVAGQNAKEQYSKKTYGKGGKEVKGR